MFQINDFVRMNLIFLMQTAQIRVIEYISMCLEMAMGRNIYPTEKVVSNFLALENHFHALARSSRCLWSL